MIIYNFLYFCNLYSLTLFGKYKSIRMNKVHSILVFSITMQQMTPPNVA